MSVDESTGAASQVGSAPHPQAIAAMGPLRAIDAKRGDLWFLGDTGLGATLAQLSLADGTVKNECQVPGIEEVEYVAIGQTLELDAATDSLVMSGATTKGTHHFLRMPLGSPCANFSVVGDVPFGVELPMIMGSAIDAASQRLFFTISNDAGSAHGVAVVDLATGNLTRVMPYLTDVYLGGMVWADGAGADGKGALIGVQIGGSGLVLLTLSPDSGSLSSKPIDTGSFDFDQLLGNDGVVLAHDAKNGLLFVPLGKHTEDDVMYIAKVDIAQAKVTSAPKLTVDAGIAELLMLEYLAPQ